MESLFLASIIGGLGYYFSQQNNSSDYAETIRNIGDSDSTINNVPANEKPVSSNIYNSKMTEAANNEVFRL